MTEANMMSNDGPGWHLDPDSLLPVLHDAARFRQAHADDPAVEVLVALWSGQPDRAAELLEQLVVPDPTWRLQALAADVIRARGNPSAALLILEKLIDQYRYRPPEATLAQQIGLAHYTAEAFPAAAQWFRRALDLRTRAGPTATATDPGLAIPPAQALHRALAQVPDAMSHTRAWGWGVAFLYDPVHGDIVDVDPDAPVTITPTGLDVKVRHAQEYDYANGEKGPAVTAMHIARPDKDVPPHRAVVVQATLDTPTRSLSIGDADGEILVPTPGARTRVVISHGDAESYSPDQVWIELYASA